jgi:hypothetical protein
VSQQRFDTPGVVQVRVDNRAGPVRLRARSGTSTEVEVSADSDDEIADQIRVEHTEVDGRHRVLVEVPAQHSPTGAKGVRIYGRHRVRVVVPGLGDLLRSSLLGSHDVLVTVLVPEGAAFGAATVETSSGDTSLEDVGGDLNVRSESGDVTARSVLGETRITTASGDVRCGALGGASQIKTASGDVAVESAQGPLTVQTASGDVAAGDVATGCELQTVSGDQRVERLFGGRARLQSVSGDVSVGIARSTVVSVDAESLSGDLSSEIDLDPDEPPGAGARSDQRVELRARTVSGDLRIRRAPA